LAKWMKRRACAPVFVVGSPRSGTTLLYDTLLSSGGFALYLGESNIFNLLAPRFGDLSVPKNRQKMLDVWVGSRLFRVMGMDRARIERRIHEQCQNAGDFLRIVMDELAQRQKAWRWAGNAPEEILHLRHIKETIPEALIIHIIRDGRDVSVSLAAKRYIRPFPWKDRETAEGAALYWEWIVQKGRSVGKSFGDDYTEIRFEELVHNPRAVLGKLSEFLDHDLDYDRIQRNAVGTVARPNTSFSAKFRQEFNPVARWKHQLSTEQLTKIEGLIGPTLSEMGYSLLTAGAAACNKAELAWDRLLYRQFFELKLQWKKNRIARAFRPALTSHEVDEVVIVDDDATEKLLRMPEAPIRAGRVSPSVTPLRPSSGENLRSLAQ